MTYLHSERVIRATSKRHACVQCGEMIEAGSPAHYAFGVYEDGPYSIYVHIECHNAAHDYATLNDMWGEEWPFFQHMEDSEFEHHGWLLENHPVVAERLNITNPADQILP